MQFDENLGRDAAPRLRAGEVFLWCLPALLIGLILRSMLIAQVPHAIFLPDSEDYLLGVRRLVTGGDFDIHSKKTFLIPLLHAMPFFAGIPLLIGIPVLQHFGGLCLVVVSGFLCRLWFWKWRWAIIPLTLAIALNPAMLWYEHAIMGEAIFALCVALMLLGASWFWYQRSWWAFAGMLAGNFAAAAARPEGKLFLGLGLLVICGAFLRERRKLAIALAVFIPFAAITWVTNSTSQPGLLLYTSVVQWTPDNPRVAPGLKPYILDVRSEIASRYDERAAFANARDRRSVSEALRKYLEDSKKEASPEAVNSFAKRVALETIARNFYKTPGVTASKYAKGAQDSPAEDFDEYNLVEKQKSAYIAEGKKAEDLSEALTGRKLTVAGLEKFVDYHYHPERLGFIRWWNKVWNEAALRWATPESWIRLAGERPSSIPYLQILAFAGLAASFFRPGRFRWFYVLWGIVFLGYCHILIFTAPAKARFTYVFEIFWPIYALLLLDTLWFWVERFRPKQKGKLSPWNAEGARLD